MKSFPSEQAARTRCDELKLKEVRPEIRYYVQRRVRRRMFAGENEPWQIGQHKLTGGPYSETKFIKFV